MPIFDPSSIVIGEVEANRIESSPGNNLTGSGSTSVTGPEGPSDLDDGLYKSPYVYAGYTDAVTGANDGHLVLHYDGIYNTRNSDDTIQHTSGSLSTWSDLSGRGNHARIVSNSSTETVIYDLKDSKENVGSEQTGGSYTNASVKVEENHKYMNLNGVFASSKVLNNIPEGDEEYTIEVTFEYNKQQGAGIFGMGTYNSVYKNKTSKDGSPLKVLFNEGRDSGTNSELSDWDIYYTSTIQKLFLINDAFYTKFGYIPYQARTDTMGWFTSNIREWGSYTVDDVNANSQKNTTRFWNKDKDKNLKDISVDGKSNAIRTTTNDPGEGGVDGFRHYHWGNDKDTGTILNKGRHTITVKYDKDENNDGNTDDYYTYIYLDGKEISGAKSKRKPNTLVREITVGATNKRLKTYLNDDLKQGRITFEFEYIEFLNDKVYSVRIYDRALSQSEITHNYNLDNIRFGS